MAKKIEHLIKLGYKYIRRCRGDGNCYYRAIYYTYLEVLISKGLTLFKLFLDMLRHHDSNTLKNIKEDEMFMVLIIVCEQIYEKLLLKGIRSAHQHLFQSALLVPEFDRVSLHYILGNDSLLPKTPLSLSTREQRQKAIRLRTRASNYWRC